MRFCFDQLLQPLEEGLSRVFSLQFYGTRETTDETPPKYTVSLPDGAVERTSELSSTCTSQSDYYSFLTGRPDWESIFHEAIREAYRSNPNGESVGVFFSGSPAIAKCLRSTADKVNAQHRFATKNRRGKACKCKIVIHVECY